jgi:DNA polymerase V
MKAAKLPYVKTNYKFEAPVIEAKVKKSVHTGEKLNKLLDLNAFLAPDPESTYLVRVSGESMIDANIMDGDILVIDRHEKPHPGQIVIASLNGEMAVKYYQVEKGEIFLVSANKKFLPIKISGLFEFQIQGVVKHIIRNM